MKLKQVGIAGLTLLFGCVRLGYEAHSKARDGGIYTGDVGMDGAVTRNDASQLDARGQIAFDAAAQDAATDANTPRDAGSPHDAGSLRDASSTGDASAARDAGSQRDAAAPGDASTLSDAAQTDAGSMDAAMSGSNPCSFAITMNRYVGKQHYHGYLTLQNTGTSTWTLPSIRFDLPSTIKVCNDVEILPGAGWTLQSMSGHCEYTKILPALSIAAGDSLNFEYSSDYTSDIADPAAANVSLVGCP